MFIDPLKRHHVQVIGGPGPALVFGHGYGTDQRAWSLVAPAFATAHTVVLFDHAGCGRADPRAYTAQRHATLDGYAQDLIEILDALDLREAIYVGHSVGGAIGLLAALSQPQRFARLLLVCMSPRLIDDPPHYHGGFAADEVEGMLDLLERDQIAWAQALAPLALGETAPANALDGFAAHLRQWDPLVARRFGRLAFCSDLRARLDDVRVPSLLLHCRHDTIVPTATARFLHQRLRDSTLVEIDGFGHCPHLTQPGATIEQIQRYLQRDDQ